MTRSFPPVVTSNIRLRIAESADDKHPNETELAESEVFVHGHARFPEDSAMPIDTADREML